MMMCMFNFFLFSMVFKREENYQNTPEKIFKQVQAYINFLKLLNYQGMMMYMFKILFFNVFKSDKNYQNTVETFVKNAYA